MTGQASARVPCPGQEPWRSSAGPMSMREERDAQGFIAVKYAYDGAQLRVDVSDIGKMRLHDGVTASVQWPRVRGNQVVRDEFNRPERWAEVKQKLEAAGPGRSEPVSGKQGGAHDAKDSRRIQAAAMRQLAHDVLQ